MIVKVIESVTLLGVSLGSGRPNWMQIEGVIEEWHYEDDENPSYIELWNCHA